MNKKNYFKRAEIATLLTLGTLLVIGISTFVSSYFLKNKTSSQAKAEVCQDDCGNNFPDKESAAYQICVQGCAASTTTTTTYSNVSCTSCEGGKCIYHPELDPRSGATGVAQCTDTGCIYDSECSSTGKNTSCRAYNDLCSANPDPNDPASNCCGGLNCIGGKCQPKATIPMAACPTSGTYSSKDVANAICPGLAEAFPNPRGGYVPNCWRCANAQLDTSGIVNRACCASNKDCEANGPNQVCGVPNGACRSGKSCAEVAKGETKPKYIRTCSGVSCAWTFCNGNVDPSLCVYTPDDTNVKTVSPWCSSDDFCKTFTPTKAPGVNSCRDATLKPQQCPATYTESCGGGFSQKVHRDCTQSNTSGCQYWCSDAQNNKVACGTAASCYVKCPNCTGSSTVKKTPTTTIACNFTETVCQDNVLWRKCSGTGTLEWKERCFEGCAADGKSCKQSTTKLCTTSSGVSFKDKICELGKVYQCNNGTSTEIEKCVDNCSGDGISCMGGLSNKKKTVYIDYGQAGSGFFIKGNVVSSQVCDIDANGKTSNCKNPKVDDVAGKNAWNVTYDIDSDKKQVLCMYKQILWQNWTCVPIN